MNKDQEVIKTIKLLVNTEFKYYKSFGYEMNEFISAGMTRYLQYIIDNENKPTDNVLNSILRKEFNKMINSVRKSRKVVSLHEYIENDDIDSFIYNLDSDLIGVLKESLKILTINEYNVIIGLSLSQPTKTRAEMAKELNISPQRVSQLYKAAEEKIRKYFNDNT